jgi:Bacterial pullanase-associated domain
MYAFRRPVRFLAALALGAAAALAAQAQSALPDGKVGIHYNRCDSAYDGWGLHVWKNPGIPTLDAARKARAETPCG